MRKLNGLSTLQDHGRLGEECLVPGIFVKDVLIPTSVTKDKSKQSFIDKECLLVKHDKDSMTYILRDFSGTWYCRVVVEQRETSQVLTWRYNLIRGANHLVFTKDKWL